MLLSTDLQTPCYADGHMATAVAIALLFLLFTFLFPFGCFVVLVRAFADAETAGVAGWLVRRWPRLFQDPRRVLRNANAMRVHKMPGATWSRCRIRARPRRCCRNDRQWRRR
jgi:hypothetical protein